MRGVVDLTTGDFAAIMSQAGELSITGADTFVTAVNSSADYAAIANHSDGGLYLAARISATNNGGGKPFEGATADGAQAITLGEGYEAYPQSGLTTEAGHTYFVDAEGVPAAGRLDVCSHRWDNPEFTWAPDGKSCSVTLTCAVDDSHTITLNSADQPGSIEYQVTTPATCTDMGTTTYTATLALDEDHVYTDSLAVVDVPAVGHQPVKTEAREASCTAEGNTAYWRCSVCGKYFSDEACTQESAPADTVVAAAGHQPVKVEAKAPTAEAVGNCEYWYCRNCGKYFSNEACTQEITLVDTVVAKLPKIIAGADQSWTKGGRDGLTVTSNGAFADFLNVQVDGRVVDSANYEAEEGSTVVTLKPAYLEGLRVGSHTLGVASRNGTATTTFTIVAQSASAPAAPSPQTGDSSLIALGAVSLALASCGLLGILLWSRRKRKD